MKSDLEGLQVALKGSLDFIDAHLKSVGASEVEECLSSKPINPAVCVSPQSILQQCTDVCDAHIAKSKPTLRIVHHLACSGGSIFSRCLAAMPNVYLLSEAHPYSNLHIGDGKAKYLPTDIVTLAKYAAVPNHRSLAKTIYADSIKTTVNHLSRYGGTLIIRDHSHIDFCMDQELPFTGATVDALEEAFEILSLLTVRDPIDSYMSLIKRRWLHFEPKTFDEYCRRYLAFIECYPASEIIRYEDFVAQPGKIMRKACKALGISYAEAFLEIFNLFQVTGESGRNSVESIQPRARREPSTDYMEEIQASLSYRELATKLHYDSEPGNIST